MQIKAVSLGLLDVADLDPAIVAKINNMNTIRAAAQAAMVKNTAAINATNPTNAQVIAQVKNLSVQNNNIIRLLLGLLDDVH